MATYRLIKAELDGTIVKSLGTKGSAPEEFKHPNGIHVSNNNELYNVINAHYVT